MIVARIRRFFYYEIFTQKISCYKYKVIAGELPPGLHLVEGFIKGIPTRLGTYSFSIQAISPCSCEIFDLVIKVKERSLRKCPVPIVTSVGVKGEADYIQLTLTFAQAPNPANVYTVTITTPTNPYGQFPPQIQGNMVIIIISFQESISTGTPYNGNVSVIGCTGTYNFSGQFTNSG